MQPPAFWRDLRDEFRALPDAAWQSEKAPGRLQASGLTNHELRADVPLSSSLITQFTSLAIRGAHGLPDRQTEATLHVWLAALRTFLNQERSQWIQSWTATGSVPPPTDYRDLALRELVVPRQLRFTIAPTGHHDPVALTRQRSLALAELTARVRLQGLDEWLIVELGEDGYVVLDDEREHMKYAACLAASLVVVGCGIREAGATGIHEERRYEAIDCVSIASADFCAALETRAIQAAPPEPDTSGVLAVATPLDVSPLLTVKKAAELLKCHEDTVREMGRHGDIEIIKMGPRRQRIKASEILRLRNTPKFSAR